jgi:hypothetical protein
MDGHEKPPPLTPSLRILSALLALAAVYLPAPASAAPPAGARPQGGQPEEIRLNQPPLTATDLPADVKILAHTRSGHTEEGWRIIVARRGLTEARMSRLKAKFMAGIGLLTSNGVEARETPARLFGTPLAVPTDPEIEVMRGALAQPTAALGVPLSRPDRG